MVRTHLCDFLFGLDKGCGLSSMSFKEPLCQQTQRIHQTWRHTQSDALMDPMKLQPGNDETSLKLV